MIKENILGRIVPAAEFSTAKSMAIFSAYTVVGMLYCSNFGIIFGVILNMPVLGWIHTVAGVILAINYGFLHATKNFGVANSVVLTVGTAIMISLFVSGGWGDTGHFWTFAYLPYIFYLAGQRRSFFWVSLLYALIGGSMILHVLGVVRLPYDYLTLINYSLAFITFTICLFLLEFAINRYAELAREQVERVKKVNKDLKEEKDKVEADKAKNEALLASLSDGMIVTDSEGRIVLMNAAAGRLLDIAPRTKVLGTTILEHTTLLGEKGKPIVQRALAPYQALRNKHGVSQVVQRVTDTAHYVTIGLTATPVLQRGQVIGALVILRDITREHEVDRMKTEFIALASHQLRTPLSAIRWFTEMLGSEDVGKLNVEQKEFTANIAESTERMIALVNSLLNTSRLESGRIIVDPKPTDMGHLVQSVVRDMRPQIEEKHHRVKVKVDETLPEINIDPRLIVQVYINLLSNAIKYTPDGGKITIEVSQVGGAVISQISDNGYGIPKNQHSKLFQKFFRAENVVKFDTDGNGLGLYLVRAIVESSGGKIWFESDEGKGTTFWFSLPLGGMKAKEGEVTLDS